MAVAADPDALANGSGWSLDELDVVTVLVERGQVVHGSDSKDGRTVWGDVSDCDVDGLSGHGGAVPVGLQLRSIRRRIS